MINNTPYVYLIGWSNHDKWYIGARWAKDCHPDDLFKTYFTSSRHVKAFIQKHGLPDVIKVRKTFDNIQSARLYEEKLLRRLDVIKSDRWINKSVNGRYLKHGAQEPDHIAKRISAGYKTRLANGGFKVSPEHALRISLSLKGVSKTFTESHKRNLKCHNNNQTTVDCPHCNKSGQLTNMKRWHFDNCSSIKERELKSVTCSVCGFVGTKAGNFYRYHEKNCGYVQRLR